MTPQQKALIAELRAADYPATWKLSATAADSKLGAGATQMQTSGRSSIWRQFTVRPAGATA